MRNIDDNIKGRGVILQKKKKMSVLSYINIHCHQPDEGKGIFIFNLFFGKPDIQLPSPQAYYSFGLHPWHIPQKNEDWKEELLSMLNLHNEKPGFLAVGEAGLDKISLVPDDLQMEAFILQATWAEHHEKPMIIHCVRAYGELLQIRAQYNFKSPWIFHGYNRNIQIARQIIKAGCYVSFGHQLFRPESMAYKTFPEIPLENFFLETDESNLYIEQITHRAAELKQIETLDLLMHLQRNFKKAFNKSLTDL